MKYKSSGSPLPVPYLCVLKGHKSHADVFYQKVIQSNMSLVHTPVLLCTLTDCREQNKCV